MIDFHTHVLPCVDDGSKSVEESVALLRTLASQGVDTVFATPHFYASNDTPNDFSERCRAARRSLKEAYLQCEELPRLYLGAEVAYFPGISSSSVLESMRLEGTQLLLLEMPSLPWSEHMIKELIEISCSPSVTLVLAHIERYLSCVSTRTLELLVGHGILLQANASSFLGGWRSRRVFQMLRNGYVHIIASDCHGMKHRPPQLDQACAAITKGLGSSVLARLDAFGASLLSDPQ